MKPSGRSYANHGYDFDAFVSYNQVASAAIAERLQRSVEGFARPWHRMRRALRIFRDLTNMRLTPKARSEVADVLKRTAWLVLVASPAAARSDWVDFEVRTWLEAGRADRLIITRADGQIDWDDADSDTNALPRPLIEHYADLEKPLWIDLVPSPNTPEAWARSVAQLSATIHGWELDEVHGEHRRQRRRMRIAVVTVAVVLVAMAGFGAVQVRQKLQERQQARSQEIAAEAVAQRTVDPALARQLSVVAYRTWPTLEARSALLSTASLPRVTRFHAHDRAGWSLSATADGKRVATSGGDGAVQIWEGTGRPARLTVGTAAGVPEPVESTVLSSDGRTVAAADFDGRIQLWDLTDPAHPAPRPVVPGTGRLGGMAFSPDNRTLASVRRDGMVRVWHLDREQGQELTRQESTTTTVASAAIAFSSDGRTLAAAVGATVRLWRLDDAGQPQPAEVPLPVSSGNVGALAFHPGRPELAVGFDSGAVELWDVGSSGEAERLRRLTGHSATATALDFSGDGALLLSGGNDKAVIVWDLATGKTLHRLPHPQGVRGAAFLGSADEIGSVGIDGYLRLWHLRGPLLTGEHTAVASALFRPGTPRILAAGGLPNVVRLWNVSDPLHPTIVARPDAERPPVTGRMAFRPDGAILAVPREDGRIELWDVSDPSAPHLVGGPFGTHEGSVLGVAFDPGGKVLASAGFDRTARLWDVSDPADPQPLSDPLRPDVPDPGAAASVAFSQDGVLAVGNGGGAVMLYDVSLPRVPRELADPLGAPGAALGLAWRGDDRALAVAGTEGRIDVWERGSREEFHPVRNVFSSAGPALSVVFIGDDRLAVGNGDGSTWIWNVAEKDPEVVARLIGPSKDVLAVGYSGDAGLLVSGAGDGMTVLWDLNEKTVIADICRSTGDLIQELRRLKVC